MNPQYHAEDQKIIVRIPINLRRWGGKKVLVGPQGQDLRRLDLEVRKDEKLLKALGRAYRWHKMIAIGQYQSVSELAEAENINKSYPYSHSFRWPEKVIQNAACMNGLNRSRRSGPRKTV